MKKISLSVVAVFFAASSVIAAGSPVKHANKAKQASCTACPKTNCTKGCMNKAECRAMSCTKN